MHLFICNHQATRLLDGLNNFSCTFQCGPYWGWLARWLLLLYILHPHSGTAGIWPLLGVLVLQCLLSNTLDFWNNIECSAPYLRILSLLLCVQSFGGSSEVVSELDDHFRAIWFSWSDRYPRRSPLLFTGFFSSDFFWQRFCGLLVPLLYSLWEMGSKII